MIVVDNHMWSSSSISSSILHVGLRRSVIPGGKSVLNLSIHLKQFTRCRASWQELAGVLVFSAIPFTAVKAIANSPLGETLQRQMQDKKKLALKNASLYQALSQNAKKDSIWYGEERPRWLGPIPYEYPTYLNGELPGDYGFDIAGLSEDPVAFKRYYK